MRRSTIAVILALGLLGCSDSLTPPSAPSSVRGDIVAAAANIRAQLSALIPAGGLLNAANAQFDNVEKSWTSSPQKIDVARQQAAALCRFAVKLEAKLQDPDGAGGPQTVSGALAELCGSLNLYVGLTPTGTDVSGPNAIAVFVPNDPDGTEPTLVVTPNKHAGVLIPQGAFGEDVTVIISPIADTDYPLVAPQSQQYPYFYHIETVPAVSQFQQNVTVGICTKEDVPHPAQRLRLAHNINNNSALEVLPLATVTFLDCDTPINGIAMAPRLDREVLFSRRVFAAAAQGARYLGSRAAQFVLPTTVYATNIQLGGSSGSFSPFGGYDPGPSLGSAAIDFETYPATLAAGPTPTCARCIVTTEYQSRGVVFSWQSTAFPSPTYGATLTSNSPYNDAAAGGTNHVVTTALDANGLGLAGTVVMTFAGLPGVVEYDRTVPTSSAAVTTVTDGANSTTGAAVTVTPLGTFTSVAGYAMSREHVRITATQGIASIALDMNGVIQTIDNLQLNPVTVTSLTLASSTLVINGAATSYTAVVSNAGASLSNVVLQGWVEQGSARRAAGGIVATCTPTNGVLPTGSCTMSFSAGASNSAAGTGTLVAGSASYVLEVLQNAASGQTVLASKAVPVTLTGP